MNTLLSINSFYLTEIITSLGICVVLPCLIVFLVLWARRNETNRKTEVALKAIEKGFQVDPNFFASRKAKKTVKSKVFGYLATSLILLGLGLAFSVLSLFPMIVEEERPPLIIGMSLLLLGIAFLAIYFIARKQFAAEIKSEEEELSKEE